MKIIWGLSFLFLLAFARPAAAIDPCNCKGYAGPGGPCYAGPGGPAYDGPGGQAYSGPGGACYAGPVDRDMMDQVVRHTRVLEVLPIVAQVVLHMTVQVVLLILALEALAMQAPVDLVIPDQVEQVEAVRQCADKLHSAVLLIRWFAMTKS